MSRLMPDTPAPELSIPLVGGGRYVLSAETPAVLSMIVVYRGLHCPICRDYLQKLNRMAPEFEAAGAGLVALSMDPEDRAAQAKAGWGLDALRVGYGMGEATARAWGLYLSAAIRDKELPLFPEPGLFWVRRDGTLCLIDVATMPFARPDLDLLLPRIQRIADGYPARGTA